MSLSLFSFLVWESSTQLRLIRWSEMLWWGIHIFVKLRSYTFIDMLVYGENIDTLSCHYFFIISFLLISVCSGFFSDRPLAWRIMVVKCVSQGVVDVHEIYAFSKFLSAGVQFDQWMMVRQLQVSVLNQCLMLTRSGFSDFCFLLFSCDHFAS